MYLRSFKKNNDYTTNTLKPYPDGLDVEVVKLKALIPLEKSKSIANKEHVPHLLKI